MENMYLTTDWQNVISDLITAILVALYTGNVLYQNLACMIFHGVQIFFCLKRLSFNISALLIIFFRCTYQYIHVITLLVSYFI